MHRTIVFAAALAVTALSACSATGGPSAASTTVGAPTSTTVAATSTSTVPDRADDAPDDVDPEAFEAAVTALEGLLIVDLPAGFVQEDDEVGDTGPSDLDKAIDDDGGDQAEELLTDAGFVAGYQRLWTRDDDEIVVFLYRFETEAGAERYDRRTIEDLTTYLTEDDPAPFTAFDVPGVPGAHGFDLDEEDHSTLVFFRRGDVIGIVQLYGPSAGPAAASALVTQQYQRLG